MLTLPVVCDTVGTDNTESGAGQSGSIRIPSFRRGYSHKNPAQTIFRVLGAKRMKDDFRVMWDVFKTITPYDWAMAILFFALVSVVCISLAIIGG